LLNYLQCWTLQDFNYLYDPNNETAGAFVPAQILYDAFHGRYHNAAGAIVLLFIIWGSFFFGGLSITTSAARVVSKQIPLERCFRSILRLIHRAKPFFGSFSNDLLANWKNGTIVNPIGFQS